jgi:hypothetical protein
MKIMNRIFKKCEGFTIKIQSMWNKKTNVSSIMTGEIRIILKPFREYLRKTCG